MDRTIVAYFLIAVVIAFVGAIVARIVYTSNSRRYERQRRRDRAMRRTRF